MSISHRYQTDRAKLALELTMRDTLAGMEELANLNAYWFNASCLEILSIESPHSTACVTTPASPCVSAAILNFPEQRRRTG